MSYRAFGTIGPGEFGLFKVGHNLPRYRKLTPAQEEAVREDYGHGVRAHVLAGRYGVTERTIYRTLDRIRRAVEQVELGGYFAEFEIGPEGPVQITPWRAVSGG